MGIQETFVRNISHGRWLKVGLHADWNLSFPNTPT